MGIIAGLLKLISALVGVVFFLFGLMMLAFEILVWFGDRSHAAASLGLVWFQNDPFSGFLGTPSLPLASAIIERKISPLLWDPFIVTILAWPSWLALLFLGVFSLMISSALLRFASQSKKS
ncbi:hypothetical protein MNBD_ALPHA12-1421 [hydrothermal vent metagenome]|uniref:Uncharacterized protein n=1 Tax=hydrothermal vent metagenome TaxID=652676 RepID=A0A3B0U6G5_9ZZZZ